MKLGELLKAGFGGVIAISRDPFPWRKGKLRPRPGADLTVRQVVNGLSFHTATGLTGGTNQLYMSNAGGFGAVFNHALNDLPQATSWTNVYDQYKFEEVELHLMPIVTDATTTTTATNVPTGATQVVLDFDDGNALSSENAALEYDNCQSAMWYDNISVRYKPAVAPAFWASGAFSGYGTDASDERWLNCSSPSIPNYGVKMWVAAIAATSSMIAGWVVYGQYTISFRNVR